MKSPVFPWNKFAGVDTVLGPEMKSTGEVMGVASSFGEAFAKAQLSAGQVLPDGGTLFLSVNDNDKVAAVDLAHRFVDLGFNFVATEGTANVLEKSGLTVERVFKVDEAVPTPSISSRATGFSSSSTRRTGLTHSLTRRRFAAPRFWRAFPRLRRLPQPQAAVEGIAGDAAQGCIGERTAKSARGAQVEGISTDMD